MKTPPFAASRLAPLVPRVALIVLVALVACVTLAIGPDQIDTFDDGTTANWEEGSPSPNPPVNVADGGPLGPGDGYLENSSSGGGGPGSRLVMYNRVQWTGDFESAGIRQIEFDARNLGDSSIQLRVAFQSLSNTRWASTDAVTLAPQGEWTSVAFMLDEASMTRVSGIDDFATSLATVNEFRILSAQVPDWLGAIQVGTLGVDNVFASTVPVELLDFGVE